MPLEERSLSLPCALIQYHIPILFKLCLSFAGCLTSTLLAAAEHDCLIEARQRVDIRSPVEAVIESVQVQRGDLVKKGQVIATLESGPERAALDLAKSRATMQGELKAAEARVDLTQKKQVRAEELYKQNFVSVNARDEAEADYRLATEQFRQAKENQKLAVGAKALVPGFCSTTTPSETPPMTWH